MRIFKVLIVFFALSVMLTGCKKPVKTDGTTDAAIGYQDIPLSERSLEDFLEIPAELKYVFQTVYFDYNKHNIRSSEAAKLSSIAEWMNDNSSKHLLVEGHCDERGSNEYNLALGEQRSLGIRRYLIDLGVESSRLHTISYGEERPASYGSGEATWSKNRRAEFLISK